MCLLTVRLVNVLFPYISDILNCMFYEHKSYLINFFKYMKRFKMLLYCLLAMVHVFFYHLQNITFLTIFDETNIEP